MANQRAPKPTRSKAARDATQRQRGASSAPRESDDLLQSAFRGALATFGRVLGWKQLVLAERLGVSKRTLTRLTVGDKPVDALLVAGRYLPRLRDAEAAATLPGQREVLAEALGKLEHVLKTGRVPSSHVPELREDERAVLEEIDALLTSATEAVEIANDADQGREVIEAFQRARRLAEARLRHEGHVSDRELRAVERIADCLLSFRVEGREGELKAIAKVLDNALGFLRRDEVWFDAEAPHWSSALCAAEVLVRRVHVALELAQPLERFGPELAAAARRVAEAEVSVERSHAPARESAWSRRLLHAHTLLLDARLEVGTLDDESLGEAMALRGRTEALLAATRDETAGHLESQFVAGEVAFLVAKLHLQVGDRARALDAHREAKWLYREAGYRGAVGQVQASMLALLHGACPECDQTHGAPALCPFCIDVYCTSCSPRLCPDCEVPIRALRRKMWLAA